MKATRLVSMVSSTVRVLRHPTTVIEAGKDVEDECEVEIERSEVVPGDVIVVASKCIRQSFPNGYPVYYPTLRR